MLRQKSEALHDVILRLFTKTRQVCYLILAASLLQFGNTINMQLVVDNIDFFRSDSRDAQHLQLDLRCAGAQFVIEGQVPRIHQFFDTLDNS